DDRLPALHDGDYRVSRAQINTNDLTHGAISSLAHARPVSLPCRDMCCSQAIHVASTGLIPAQYLQIVVYATCKNIFVESCIVKAGAPKLVPPRRTCESSRYERRRHGCRARRSWGKPLTLTLPLWRGHEKGVGD